MKKAIILTTFFLVLGMLFWSCQKSEMPVENTASNTTTLNKTVTNVVLKIHAEHVAYLTSEYPYYDLRVNKIITPWNEVNVTWESPWTNPGGDYYTTPEDGLLVTVANTGTWEIDISELWNDGLPVNGLIIRVENGATEDKRIKFTSKEGATEDKPAPEIVITYSDNTQIAYPVIEDSWISNRVVDGNDWSDDNFGDQGVLYAGKIVTMENGVEVAKEKRTVLKFELPSGCTYTQGYWKTHAKKCRKYDTTWDLIGDNGSKTIFFNSGKTYFKVLWTPPRRGNAYYILAHQYIAAELNQLNGASIPNEVLTAFNAAKTLFAASLDDTIGDTSRQEWIELAQILDDYNSGLIGPGHCDGCKTHHKKHYKKHHKKHGKKKWCRKP